MSCRTSMKWHLHWKILLKLEMYSEKYDRFLTYCSMDLQGRERPQQLSQWLKKYLDWGSTSRESSNWMLLMSAELMWSGKKSKLSPKKSIRKILMRTNVAIMQDKHLSENKDHHSWWGRLADEWCSECLEKNHWGLQRSHTILHNLQLHHKVNNL